MKTEQKRCARIVMMLLVIAVGMPFAFADDNVSFSAIEKTKKVKDKKTHNLTIVLNGSGSGRVSSKPEGIFCETDCTEEFKANKKIKLSVQPYSGSEFVGWSVASCGAATTCSVKLKEDTTVSATFSTLTVPPLSLITPYVNHADMSKVGDFFNAEYIENEPWGWIHDGLDFYPVGNLSPFQAACSGRVHRIFTFDDQVTLLINCLSNYSIEYNFEAQAPNTGQIQLENIFVTEGQWVAQGDVIGLLYSAENPEFAHVHFTLYDSAVAICPAPYFTPSALLSVQELVAVEHPNNVVCNSGNLFPAKMVTPYYDHAEMQNIAAGFSSAFSVSPWNYPHDGFDFYPIADLARFQAACSGDVDNLELQTDDEGNWQVEFAVVCDPYVDDPQQGGYFIPLTTRYVFKTMSTDPQVGLEQWNNILLLVDQPVIQGDTIGYL